MHRLTLLSIPAITILILAGCGGKTVMQEQSVLPQSYVNPVFSPLPSVISIPVAIQPSWIENMVNTVYKDVIWQNDTIKVIPGLSSAQFKVTKAETIRIGLVGDELNYRLPLRLHLRAGIDVSSFGVTLQNFQDAEAAITLRMRTTVKINPNWSLTTQTFVDGYDWISPPTVKLGMFSIPFTPLADMVLSNMKSSAGPTIDRLIAKNFDLKKQLAPLWATIERPMLIDKATGLWVRLRPDSLVMTNLRGSNGAIIGSLGIQTLAETFFGAEPAATPPRPMPDLLIRTAVDSGFVLNLYSEMPFAQAQIIARQGLCGKTFPVAGKSIVIDSLWINGDSGLIKVDVSLSGDFKGKVTLMGHPVLDSTGRVFSIADPVFDMSTRNVLLKSAKWLFNSSIQRLIAEQLHFPLDPQLASAKSMINASLAGFHPLKDVSFAGGTDSLSVRGFMLTGTGMKVAVAAQGRLAVKMLTLQ